MDSSFPTPEEQPGLFPDMISEYREGKDELNLAEFPIAALSNRVDQDTKTIIFEDSTFDQASGQIIRRSLTITASDAFGLPAASDDEVLLGLIQLTRQQGFTSPKVYFTPYKLMQILGWPTTTKNYRRLTDALNRWLGVSLFYDNAWRDRRSGQWVDQKFHFLDNVSIHRPGQKSLDGPQGYSYVKWNEVVFKSFQSGNLKALDFQTYTRLDSAIAKRMYRFLDKRFYKRSKLVFHLEKFAFDKLGLPRSYNDIAQLKRRLLPGILELEQVGFLKPVVPKLRFTKSRIGVWEVTFERFVEDNAEPTLPIDVDELSPLEGRLIGHGMSKPQAERLVSEYDESAIETQIDALEYLMATKPDKVPENRAGWLVKAITDSYATPRGFKNRQQLELEEKLKETKKERATKAKLQREDEERLRKEKLEKTYEAEEQLVQSYLEVLSAEQRQDIEITALKRSPHGRGRLSAQMREVIIHNFVLELIREGGPQKA
jgi:hypothetical protein